MGRRGQKKHDKKQRKRTLQGLEQENRQHRHQETEPKIQNLSRNAHIKNWGVKNKEAKESILVFPHFLSFFCYRHKGGFTGRRWIIWKRTMLAGLRQPRQLHCAGQKPHSGILTCLLANPWPSSEQTGAQRAPKRQSGVRSKMYEPGTTRPNSPLADLSSYHWVQWEQRQIQQDTKVFSLRRALSCPQQVCALTGHQRHRTSLNPAVPHPPRRYRAPALKLSSQRVATPPAGWENTRIRFLHPDPPVFAVRLGEA